MIECVPNISDGRDRGKIDSIASYAASVKGVHLLHVDPNPDANRSVITMLGEPDAVLEGAFRLYERSKALIDMEMHSGEHPCIGSVDVCPFVYLRSEFRAACIEVAHQLGKRVASELQIPVFYYGEAATERVGRDLASLRRGGFLELPARFANGSLVSDEGPNRDHRTFGATIIGARPVLIAFNVSLHTSNVGIARKIAARLRESGRVVGTNAQAGSQRESGALKTVKAIGWDMRGYGCCQVSTNVTDFRVAGLHQVFERCVTLASEFGVRVIGSEIVGLVPEEAMVLAGEYFARLGGYNESPVKRDKLITLAIKSLGLSLHSEFVPEERILERVCRAHDLAI